MVNNDDTIDPGEGLTVQMWVAPNIIRTLPAMRKPISPTFSSTVRWSPPRRGRPASTPPSHWRTASRRCNVARLTPGQQARHAAAAPFGHLTCPLARMTVAGIDAELKPATHRD